MAEISKIVLPSGNIYDIKDQTARDAIAGLSGYTNYLGVTTTALTDGSTTNPIVINETSTTAQKGDIVNYESKEFIWNGSAWQEFGDLSGLGDLAFEDSASGSFTPAGSVSAPTITVTPSTTSVSEVSSVGVLPAFSATVTSETLTFSWSGGSLPSTNSVTVATGISSASATTPTFTGTAGTVTVS